MNALEEAQIALHRPLTASDARPPTDAGGTASAP